MEWRKKRPKLVRWCGLLVNQAWGTVNMVVSWVSRQVGSMASTSTRSLGPWRVGRALAQHTTQRRLGLERPGWGTHELLGAGTELFREGDMGICGRDVCAVTEGVGCR